MKKQKKNQVINQGKKKRLQKCGPPSTFALVKFSDESYFIANNNQVKIIRGDQCTVKYKGAHYDAILLQTSDSCDFLKDVQNNLLADSSLGLANDALDVEPQLNSILSEKPLLHSSPNTNECVDINFNLPDKGCDAIIASPVPNVDYGVATNTDGQRDTVLEADREASIVSDGQDHTKSMLSEKPLLHSTPNANECVDINFNLPDKGFDAIIGSPIPNISSLSAEIIVDYGAATNTDGKRDSVMEPDTEVVNIVSDVQDRTTSILSEKPLLYSKPNTNKFGDVSSDPLKAVVYDTSIESPIPDMSGLSNVELDMDSEISINTGVERNLVVEPESGGIDVVSDIQDHTESVLSEKRLLLSTLNANEFGDVNCNHLKEIVCDTSIEFPTTNVDILNAKIVMDYEVLTNIDVVKPQGGYKECPLILQNVESSDKTRQSPTSDRSDINDDESSDEDRLSDLDYICNEPDTPTNSDTEDVGEIEVSPEELTNGHESLHVSLNVTPKVPFDDRNLTVQPSKDNGARKKYFCPYCKNLQSKFPRHLERIHKNESDVKKFMGLPMKNPERRKIIDTLRNFGGFLYNTQEIYNKGNLLVTRRPQAKYKRTVDHFVPCPSCKGFYSKLTLRLHFARCNKKPRHGQREINILSRKIIGKIHSKASDILRFVVFPVLREDDVTCLIRYDELIILYGNKLCRKYTYEHQHDMIRAQLRLLGRFKKHMSSLNPQIHEFQAIFDPKHYDNMIAAINLTARFDSCKHVYKAPSVASALTTLIKKTNKMFQAECIKNKRKLAKKEAEDFLTLFEEDVPATINKTVIENQIHSKRQQKVILPNKSDIKLLHDYLKDQRKTCMGELQQNFTSKTWFCLAESVLILLQMFNRRRAGEIERLLIEDYDNRDSIDERLHMDIFKDLSLESQEIAKKYVRLTIRGKLSRPVPVLMHSHLAEAIEMLLKHRKAAGVSESNPYLFGIPHMNKSRHRYLRACNLMRKFSTACGATLPTTLRGTQLRKHVATYSAMLNLEDNQVSDLANFMGHGENIHRQIYRQPVPHREILQISRLLEKVQGCNEDESTDTERSDDDEELDVEQPRTNHDDMPRTNEYFDSSNSLINNTELNSSDNCNSTLISNTSVNIPKNFSCRRRSNKTKTSLNSTEDTSPRRRSTSPYGKTMRRRWSVDEKAAVTRHLKEYLNSGNNLPTLGVCQDVIAKESILQSRTPQQLKAYINNVNLKNRR